MYACRKLRKLSVRHLALASIRLKHWLIRKVCGLRYADRETLAKIDLDVAGIFVQIGLIPNSQFLPEQVEVNKFGEIVVNQKGETSADGIFACGDVTTVPYKQIVIAMGDGANVALATAEYVTARQPTLQAV